MSIQQNLTPMNNPVSSGPPPVIITDPTHQNLPSVSPRPNRRKYELPTTSVELCISAQNLLLAKADPVCVLYFCDPTSNEWNEMGRTEKVKSNHNPAWTTKFVLEYRFEQRQMMKFAIYNGDTPSNTLSSQNFLGNIECSLGEIVAAPNKKFVRELELPKHLSGKSAITVEADELGDNKLVLGLKINCRNLDKKDFFGKSDPYLMISKRLDDRSWTVIHKTEVIKNNLNPDWRHFTLRIASLTSGGNLERALRFQVFDWNTDGSTDIIGEFQTSYTDIKDRVKAGNAAFELIHKSKQERKKLYKNSGILTIESLSITQDKTFIDYIQNGLQLHLTVAVDFTSTNGAPDCEGTLHYRKTTDEDNQYSCAIKAIANIIQDYDFERQFQAFGFGAKVPLPSSTVSHRFPLNGSKTNPCCTGVEGVLEAYWKTLKSATLAGPTNFAPVINFVAKSSAVKQTDGKHYTVLVIITDGAVTDMEATKEAIIDGTSFPISIIVIGVGEQDFGPLEALDADSGQLRQYGKKAAREIVQFVELENFMQKSVYNLPPKFHAGSKDGLARAALAEVPGQVMHWMKNFGPDATAA